MFSCIKIASHIRHNYATLLDQHVKVFNHIHILRYIGIVEFNDGDQDHVFEPYRRKRTKYKGNMVSILRFALRAHSRITSQN